MSTNTDEPPASSAASQPTSAPRPRPTPSRLALRIGVLQSGRLVEERLLSGSGEVRVGSEPRCDVVLPPQSGVPRTVALFRHRDGRFVLQLGAGVSAQLAAAPHAPVTTLDETSPTAHRHPLGDEARGRLVLGDVTLLFQVVRVTPARRVALPPALHDSLMHKLDGWMVGTALASFAAHAILMVVLRGYDPPRRPDIAEIPERAGRFVYMALPPKPPAPAPTATSRAPTERPPTPTAHGPRPGPRPSAAPTTAETPEARRERIRAAVAALLTASGPPGSLRDVLQGGATMADAERALSEANAVSVATRPGTPLALRGGGGPPAPTTIAGLHGPIVGEVATGERKAAQVPRCPGGLCAPPPPPPPEPGCDPASVVARMRDYRGQLVACYERLRKHDPGAAGKVHLSITVEQCGLVGDASVEPDTLDSDELRGCIERAARRWTFPELNCPKLSMSQVLIFQPQGN